MEAGPRDNEETAVDEVERSRSLRRIDGLTGLDEPADAAHLGNGEARAGRARQDEPEEALPPRGGRTSEDLAADDLAADDPASDGLGSEELSADDLAADEPDPDDAPPDADGGDVEPQELRPQRKLRVWQLAPIVVLSALGSLMFAFPLAFEPGGGTGAVVSMLGLLICGCAAGWAVLAARRAGLSWPGLPAPDSGERPDWRIVALYAAVVVTVVVLAIWRVARLRA